MELDGIDLTTETVRTQRLLLRPYRADDAEAVHRACQDPEILRWLTVPSPYTLADAVVFTAETMPSARAEKRALGCAVEVDGDFIGSAGLSFTEGLLGPGVGYWIAPWARGRGYATEAARALADWGLGRGAHRIHLFADVDNAASLGAARRAGFTAEGTVRGCLDYRDGSRADAVLFGRVAGD